MTKQRVHFKITIEGYMDMDLDEDDCPLHEFSSQSTEELLHNMSWSHVEPHEIEKMEAECRDPWLIQLARCAG